MTKRIQWKEMRINRRFMSLAALVLVLASVLPAHSLSAARDDRAEVRRVVQRIFEQWKSRQYDELYNSLSASSRSRISRERFTGSLQRTESFYELERIEIGRPRITGSRAVVNTVIYARVLKPTESEGKIVAQQTLVREDGQWRVATGSAGGLSSTPARVYVKRDGRWVDVTSALRSASRRRG